MHVLILSPASPPPQRAASCCHSGASQSHSPRVRQRKQSKGEPKENKRKAEGKQKGDTRSGPLSSPSPSPGYSAPPSSPVSTHLPPPRAYRVTNWPTWVSLRKANIAGVGLSSLNSIPIAGARGSFHPHAFPTPRFSLRHPSLTPRKEVVAGLTLVATAPPAGVEWGRTTTARGAHQSAT